MTNATNADIAALFLQLFSVHGQQTEAQMLAVARATATTAATFNTTGAGQQFGFTLGSNLGAATFNVGSHGAAFGGANNSTPTVSFLLQHVNASPAGLQMFGNDSNDLFEAINSAGDSG